MGFRLSNAESLGWLRGDVERGLSLNFQIPFSSAYGLVFLVICYPIVGSTNMVEVGGHARDYVHGSINGSL
jgi:hypothetical protein